MQLPVVVDLTSSVVIHVSTGPSNEDTRTESTGDSGEVILAEMTDDGVAVISVAAIGSESAAEPASSDAPEDLSAMAAVAVVAVVSLGELVAVSLEWTDTVEKKSLGRVGKTDISGLAVMSDGAHSVAVVRRTSDVDGSPLASSSIDESNVDERDSFATVVAVEESEADVGY